jgi:TetR/AcrR family transcriptional regulator, tetracycline repressor protein
MERRKRQGLDPFAALASWDQPPPARPFVTREQLVRQALSVLDETGLDGLTMRRVAERLGVQAASLYNHVRDKGELLALLADAVSGELPAIDATKPWRGQLETAARDYRLLLHSHRDAARLLAATPPVGVQRVQAMEQLLDVLCRAGFSDQDVTDAAFVFNTFVVGFVLDETQGMADAGASPEEFVAQIRQWFRTLPPEQFPRLTVLTEQLFEPDTNRRFEFGLKMLLDGLELRRQARRQGSASPT